MADPHPIPPADVSPEGSSHNRRVPPLVWVILALLIGLAAYAFIGGGLSMPHADAAKTPVAATS